MNELDAEIFTVGDWVDARGTKVKVTMAMLKDMVKNFNSLKDKIKVSLKLGHNDEQPFTDGKPNLGKAESVWVDGDTLFAKMVELPDIIFDSIKKKLYTNVSIEALKDVTDTEGNKYGIVLTAIALLGEDLPAVNTLADLTTYMSAKNLTFGSHLAFSKKPFKLNSGGSTMTPEEQAEFDRMKAQVIAQAKVITDNASKIVEFSQTELKHKGELDVLKASGKEAEFARAKDLVTTDLEALVKENKITPAQRDKLTTEFTEENQAQVLFSVNMLKDNAAMGTSKEQGQQNKDDSSKNADQPADMQVSILAQKFSAENKVTFSQGVKHVLSTDPKLAREYADLHDEDA